MSINVPGQINAAAPGPSEFDRETKNHGAGGSEVPVDQLESSVFTLVSPVRLQYQNRYYKEVESVWVDMFLGNDKALVVGSWNHNLSAGKRRYFHSHSHPISA